MTYSIVARHPATGQLGVAAQSHYLGVGSLVGWGQAGVGVVATQAQVRTAYGPLALAALADGEAPAPTLARLVADDAEGNVRQVAVLSAAGQAAAHTGDRCIPHFGHQVGDSYSVQGNMLRHAGIPEAMAEAYEALLGAGEPLVVCLLGALDAAEAAGGDVRGRQAASLLVVGPERGHSWEHRLIDVRVEDHPDPLPELGRLAAMAVAYAETERLEDLVKEGGWLEAVERFEALRPALGDNPEQAFWLGRWLKEAGEGDMAAHYQGPALRDPGWRALDERLDELAARPNPS
jgi:uncharacterized Ntn-hydrolase superfamily protein